MCSQARRHRPGDGTGRRLRLIGLSLGDIPNFYALDRALRGGEATAEAAYALAASAVAMVARRHPTQSLQPMLDRLKAGEGFDAALLASTGSTLGRFELEWQQDVRKRYGILVWAMAGGFWLVIAFGVMLATWLRGGGTGPGGGARSGWWWTRRTEDPAPLIEAVQRLKLLGLLL